MFSVSSTNAFLTRWGWAVALAVLAVGGCGPLARDRDPATEIAARRVRSEVGRGPVRVTAEVTPSPARLSDELTLTLTVTYEAGVDVDVPPLGAAIGDFAILDFQQPPPGVSGNRQRQRQIYQLEPLRTGRLAIDPIRVTYADGRPGEQSEESAVETEALEVTVTSMIDEEAPSLNDLRPATPPVALPRARTWIGWLVGIAACLLAAGALWARRRRGPAAPERAPSAEEVARRALQQLEAEQLAARDVKSFYVRLTAIVRCYIERTKGIHAPEQTTEEFLSEIGSGDVYSLAERQRLKDFLESADLVKYAAHQPQPDDVAASLERARAFMRLTETGAA
jgi:hypothetical protein